MNKLGGIMAGAKRGRKSAWDTKIEPRLLEIAAWCRNV